ncbi:MAG: phosphoenolpyruvate carboxykinase (ATP), partial [Acidimicrobiaceae bacterium]|nr:phosphoenolpyruvate carboxykinase (ATP) [Acidimicrobiaceae bacterium]
MMPSSWPSAPNGSSAAARQRTEQCRRTCSQRWTHPRIPSDGNDMGYRVGGERGTRLVLVGCDLLQCAGRTVGSLRAPPSEPAVAGVVGGHCGRADHRLRAGRTRNLAHGPGGAGRARAACAVRVLGAGRGGHRVQLPAAPAQPLVRALRLHRTVPHGSGYPGRDPRLRFLSSLAGPYRAMRDSSWVPGYCPPRRQGSRSTMTMTMTRTVTSSTAIVAAELFSSLGLETVDIHCGLSQDELFAAAIAGDLGRVRPGGSDNEHKARATVLGADGPLIFYSDPSCTGRPVHDTFCVDRPSISEEVWWKDGFAPFDAGAFDSLVDRVVSHLNQRRARLYVADLYCGADLDFAEPCRFVGEYASHAYFCNIMLPAHLNGAPDHRDHGWTLLNVPSFHCNPSRDGTRSERAVIIDMERRLALVLGRADYCGVNKKTMFTIMNF